MSNFWKKFFSKLAVTSTIGGLHISPSAIRYSSLSYSGRMVNQSLRLPPGIISDGRIEKKEQFIEALKILRRQVFGQHSQDLIPVIVSLPLSRNYIQTFSLPIVQGQSLDEALDLNLKMISPIPLESAYYDAQPIGHITDTNQIEYLGAFASSVEVNLFSDAISAAGWFPAAIEFPSLSLSRFFVKYASGVRPDSSYLLLTVNDNGLNFLIIKNGNLYFDYYVSWESVIGQSKNSDPAVISSAITRSFQQVIHFYIDKMGVSPSELFLIMEGKYEDQIKKAANKFNLSIKNVQAEKFPQTPSFWFISLGLAIRGLISRSDDELISIARQGTEDMYRDIQVLSFIRFWRNITASVLVFFVIILASSNWLFFAAANRLKIEGSNAANSQNVIMSEVAKLKTEAESFNRLLALIENSNDLRFSWAPYLDEINSIAQGRVNLRRIFFQSPNVPVLVTGTASNVELVLAFRDRMDNSPNFTQINLPLANVSQTSTGVSFTISFSFSNPPIR